MKITINNEQRIILRKIWLNKFGNSAKHCTMANHKFIQNILEQGQDNRQFFINGYNNMQEDEEHPLYNYPNKHSEHLLTSECLQCVDLILEDKIDEAIKFITLL